MTGYGRGTGELDGLRMVVEMRSVNHRYLDLKVRGSGLDPAAEERVTRLCRARLKRGSVTISVKVDRKGAEPTVRVDPQVARRTYHQLRELGDLFDLDEGVTTALLCAQPGVLSVTEVERDAEAVAECAAAAAAACLDALVAMREEEGKTLKDDLTSRLARLVALADQVDELARDAPADAQKRINERIGRLLGNVGVEPDPDRIAHEVAVLADRLDITEELVRVRSHVKQVEKLLQQADKSIGRRLDFLVQELGREFNTVTSKSQSAEIAGAVVEAKSELEKIREQVQNVE